MSVVNTELSLKVNRVMLMIFSIDFALYQMYLLHFKVFLTIYMHQSGWLSERGRVIFKICFRKRGYPERGGGGRGGLKPWRKLWMYLSSIKGALSSLRQFLAIDEILLKVMKNAFYFTSKALFILKILKFLSWCFGHVAKQL